MKLEDIVDAKQAKKDKNGIYVMKLALPPDVHANQLAWEKIYNFTSASMRKDRQDFFANKLLDHTDYIERTYPFKNETLYLEIGCGPAYIGEYLMQKYDCSFVGIDFNYPMLVNLRVYLKKKGYKKFILIYADISKMPIKNNSVDFIYGGGVIEHFRSTENILSELYRVLKKNGVAFNTVPAFNLFWLTRCYNSIPSVQVIKTLFENLHEKILNGALLSKYHGYELSFPLSRLQQLYKQAKFVNITAGSFAFHPSTNKLKNPILRSIYFTFSKHPFVSPMYFIVGKK